jgi:hypothetical protein
MRLMIPQITALTRVLMILLNYLLLLIIPATLTNSVRIKINTKIFIIIKCPMDLQSSGGQSKKYVWL